MGSTIDTRAFAVQAENLGKAWRRYARPADRVREWLTLGKSRGHRLHWALRDVSFGLRAGAALGLCGANGAGKSTLLRLLAGATPPSEGRLCVHGRVASLIELGAGFHLDFTGRENVLQSGVLSGASRREVQRRMDAILDFAEIGAAADEPVRTYSTGMAMRLSFAAAIGFDPEILILDEVFAVGDMYFQKKCVDRLFEHRRAGRTILLCSHSLYDLRQMCDEALWLEAGRVMASGDALRVTNDYAAFQREHIDAARSPMSVPRASPPVEGDEWPCLLDARVVRAGSDDPVREVKSGESIEVRVWWRNPAAHARRIHIGIGFLRQDHTLCAGIGTHVDGVALIGTEGCCTLSLPRLALLAGTFQIGVYLFDEHGVHRYQELAVEGELVVRNDTREVGLVRLEHGWITDLAQAPPANASSGPEDEPPGWARMGKVA